jgi:hypothetical protein
MFLPWLSSMLPHRVVDDRQVAQAQEVHLEQAERLSGRVVELRDDRAVGGPAHQRDVVDRLGPHDEAPSSTRGTVAGHWHEFRQPRSELAGRRPKYPSSAGGEAFGD